MVIQSDCGCGRGHGNAPNVNEAWHKNLGMPLYSGSSTAESHAQIHYDGTARQHYVHPGSNMIWHVFRLPMSGVLVILPQNMYSRLQDAANATCLPRQKIDMPVVGRGCNSKSLEMLSDTQACNWLVL